MKSLSIWLDKIKKNEYPELDEDKLVDVLIIGGGITGASALYHLRNANLSVMLVEQNKIGESTTGRSTGKLSFLQNDLIDKIRDSHNDSIALKYLESQKNAIDITLGIITRENIECDLKRLDAYLYTNKLEEVEKIKKLEDFLVDSGFNIKKGNCNLVESKYMIKTEDSYVFHPVKFVSSLIKRSGLPVYEKTSVKKIEKKDGLYICNTGNYVVRAKWVILASHYPYFLKPFLFPMKSSIEKSYLSASIYNGKPLSLISYSYPFISMRTHNEYLIYLSNSHSLNSDVDDKKNFLELIKKNDDLNLKPTNIWSNNDIITSDGLPYIGVLKENMLIATGYNTWGLASGVLAGRILTDIILEKNNEYIELFNPKRCNASIAIGIFSNALKSLDGYIKGYTNKRKEHPHKCPHMGCNLVYNEVEKTWDCPCHGSRFKSDGSVIESPANREF